MDGRGNGSHNGPNRPQFNPQFIARGDQPPANQLQGILFALMDFLMDLGVFDGGFGIALNAMEELQHIHEADDNNADIDNNENTGINNAVVIGIGNDNSDDDGVFEDAGMDVDHDVPEEDPLPGGSQRRSREEDEEESEARSNKRFRWWDEFSDSDSYSDTDDTDYGYLGNNSVQDASAEVDVEVEVAEEDPQPDAVKKRSRDDGEEDDERDSKRLRGFADSISDSCTVQTWTDHCDSSSSHDLFEDAVGDDLFEDADGDDLFEDAVAYNLFEDAAGDDLFQDTAGRG
ncbi:uncharacterized protein LOC108894317 [Lates calcarifer]|uniref:Uncharacterized protein LOC108894317 n=1 Tax=Lates calcarifer TaxID=8187 RepID=A0AAJ7VDR8_LATCA|nr:uncharacterized protein LOC108894317 [Lates calcarifer]XP_018548468.1 uncharacterized protein LOC108894317 [Lates calcarifer]